ncbi:MULTISPECIES: hypothetical protein [unclassified Kribbella]|uniref:hypothetical protein n=1 Tax=unclassified Kribbella TaxID=2644121 RepID=UPI0033F63F37
MRTTSRLGRVVAGVVLAESGASQGPWILGVMRPSRTVLVAVPASGEMRVLTTGGRPRRHLRLMRSRSQVPPGADWRRRRASIRGRSRTASHLTAHNKRRRGPRLRYARS